MSKEVKVGILGATGVVGQEMMKILEERDFPVASLRPIASGRSAGKTLRARSKYGKKMIIYGSR